MFDAIIIIMFDARLRQMYYRIMLMNMSKIIFSSKKAIYRPLSSIKISFHADDASQLYNQANIVESRITFIHLLSRQFAINEHTLHKML